MQGLVTIFGGSGFVGSQIVRALAKDGRRVRVAVRRPWEAYRLRLLGDVGQIEIVQANIRSPLSVDRAMEGAEACINCVAVAYESGRQRFQSLHVMGAQTLAESAQRHGVSAFVQISALGADAHSPSKYARTKADGEAAVRAVLPQATVIRPSVVFGPEDDFFNRFAAMAVLSPALPLIGGGLTRFQPVYVADVAKAAAAALTDPAAAGATYELGGPAIYSFKELMELTLKEIGRSRALIPVPWPVARLIGVGGDLAAAFIAPPLTTDQVALLAADNVVADGAPGLAALGVAPTALEPVIPTYLYRYRKGGQYADLTLEARA